MVTVNDVLDALVASAVDAAVNVKTYVRPAGKVLAGNASDTGAIAVAWSAVMATVVGVNAVVSGTAAALNVAVHVADSATDPTTYAVRVNLLSALNLAVLLREYTCGAPAAAAVTMVDAVPVRPSALFATAVNAYTTPCVITLAARVIVDVV